MKEQGWFGLKKKVIDIDRGIRAAAGSGWEANSARNYIGASTL